MAAPKAKPNRTKADYVEIAIPRAATANEDPNLFVSVNGVNYLLPKGKTSLVPSYIAEEIRRSWRAEEAQQERIEAALEAAQQ